MCFFSRFFFKHPKRLFLNSRMWDLKYEIHVGCGVVFDAENPTKSTVDVRSIWVWAQKVLMLSVLQHQPNCFVAEYESRVDLFLFTSFWPWTFPSFGCLNPWVRCCQLKWSWMLQTTRLELRRWTIANIPYQTRQRDFQSSFDATNFFGQHVGWVDPLFCLCRK